MKAKEKLDKDNLKIRFAVALTKAISEKGFASVRDFAFTSGFEPSHMQKIAAGKVDVALSTCISLVEGLGMTYSQFATCFDKVTKKDVEGYLKELEKRKKNTSTAKRK